MLIKVKLDPELDMSNGWLHPGDEGYPYEEVINDGEVPDRGHPPETESVPHLRPVRAGKRNSGVHGESEGRRVDGPDKTLSTTTKSVAGRKRRETRIGFIGRADITEEERTDLIFVGRCIARWGHTYVSVQAQGAEAAVREGVEIEGGQVESLQTGVLETANQTLLYPDTRLLVRLRNKYKDLRQREGKSVTVLERGQLGWFVNAVKEVFEEEGLEIPA